MVSNQSGVSEVFKSCLKVNFWDSDEMANQIVGFLRSNGLQNSLRINAEIELGKMSWDKSAKKMVKEYEIHARGALI